MFKSARWRSDKNKIKAVFRLKFHATQVPQLAGDALMIWMIPPDVGKPTLRLEKAKVRDGSCYWEKSVYETIKLVQDPKTGKISERLYNFVVATGLSKDGSPVGEISIDFANYAAATKLSTVSVPLKHAKFEAILHVSIERIQDSVDQRDIEEREILTHNSQDRSLRSQLSKSDDMDEIIQRNFSRDGSVKIAPDVAELSGNLMTCSGSDVTLSSSESSFGLDTPREHGMKNNNINELQASLPSSLNHASLPHKPSSDASLTIYEEHQGLQLEWSGGSAPDVSTDDSSNSPHETLIRERSQEASDSLIEKLRTELAVLTRQSEVSELELQTLRKHIVTESKRGQNLSSEIVSLKEERDAYKEECEKLQAFQKRADVMKAQNKMKIEGGVPQAFLEELQQELNHEKELNTNLHLQLQKTQESNSELILAIRDLDEMLEDKNKEILSLSNKSATKENVKDLQEASYKCDTDDDEEQKALEDLVKEHSDAKDAYLLEQKTMNLYGEIEIYQRERGDLEMQIEQLALDYEILKQENHDFSYKLEQSQLQEQLKMQYECSTSYATLKELESQIESLESDLKKQSKEFSDSLITITELESHVQSLEEELEKKAQGFEADLEDLTRAKVEQEQRAIHAEDTLRKTRWKNAKIAGRLQEEFGRLFVQMASTLDANEMLAKKALNEANELRQEKSHLEDMLCKAREKLESVRCQLEDKLLELSSQLNAKLKQIEQMQSEIEHKSIELEHQKFHAEETHQQLLQEVTMHRAEIERLTTDNDVFSKEAVQKDTLKAELEQMKASFKESEMLVQRGITERNELKNMIRCMKIEAEKSLKELNIMRSLKDEAESSAGKLKLEVETHKSRSDELKRSLLEDEFEKEKLRKQVFLLQVDLTKKEDALSNVVKKLKDCNDQAKVMEETRNSKSDLVPRGSKEVVNLKEKIRLLEGQIKLKKTALETSSNKFLEQEKFFQTKINELERSLEMLNQSAASFCKYDYDPRKVASETENFTLIEEINEEARDTAEDLRIIQDLSDVNGCPFPSTNSNNNISSESEFKDSASNSRDQDQGNLNELLKEMNLLKVRNQSMEGELKDMQQRYSEISLKFAEVEGERQQLVMTLRNLKNSKKI